MMDELRPASAELARPQYDGERMVSNLDNQVILDALGHGILIFSGAGELVQHNRMAGTILGTDLNVIKAEGWAVASELFDTGISNPDERMSVVRERAMQGERPERFYIYRSGEYVPCWATALAGTDGEVYLMLTLDMADWKLVGNVIDKFRLEIRDAVDSTIGHVNLIAKTLLNDEDKATQRIAKRVSGFTRLIGIHMKRATRLMSLLERLEDIRTGKIREIIRGERRRIDFNDFVEDFMESLDEIDLLDPETEVQDLRTRIRIELPDAVYIQGSRRYVQLALQELLRNAIMYSLRGTIVTVSVVQKNQMAQIDVIDEGYGVRQKNWDLVFKPFERGRQPQIISEFGYGLGLHLCKHEIEAMNGRMWFTSEENVGSTFSVLLPLWREASAESASDGETETS